MSIFNKINKAVFESIQRIDQAKFTIHYIDNNGYNEVRPANSTNEAIKFIKGLKDPKYFDIHGGWNTSEINGLVMWAGEGGYWDTKYKKASGPFKKNLEKFHVDLKTLNPIK